MIAASLVLLALLAGIAGTTFGLIRAEKARDVATTRAEGERQAKLEAQQERDKAREAEQAERKAREREAEQHRFAQAIADFVRNDFLALHQRRRPAPLRRPLHRPGPEQGYHAAATA